MNDQECGGWVFYLDVDPYKSNEDLWWEVGRFDDHWRDFENLIKSKVWSHSGCNLTRYKSWGDEGGRDARETGGTRVET